MNQVISDEALSAAQEMIELQDYTMGLEEENKIKFISYLQESAFTHRIDDLVDTILLSFQFRPNKLQLYIQLLKQLIELSNDSNSFHLIPTSILRNFVPIKVKYYYFLSFVQKCNLNGIISNELLLSKIKTFFKEYPQEIMPTAYLLLYFAPLIAAELPDFFSLKISLFTKQLETFGSFYEAKDFLVRFPSLQENNWALFWKQAETNYPLESIQTIIKNDDIDAFQAKTNEPNFDINQETKTHSYENIALPEVNPTLLQLAAYYGSMKIFKFILLNGANLNIRNKEGFSFEHFAIAGGDSQMIRVFEQKGCAFKKTLKTAAQFHQNILFNWINDNKEQDNSVFLDAAAANNIQVVLYYIENGIDVNMHDDDGETALHYAARYGSNDVIKLLLSHRDIDVNAGIGNRTPIDVAAIAGLTETVNLFLEAPNIQINQLDRTERTPLSNAAHFCHLNVVKELTTVEGIDFNLHGETSLAAIQDSIVKDYPHIVEYLLDVDGVDIDIKDDDFNSLLHLAASANIVDTLKILLSNPKTHHLLNSLNYEKNTPLHFAAEKPSSEFVSAIIDFISSNPIDEFDVNAQNIRGQTALHLAADKGSPVSIKLILGLPGINVNAEDENGDTPLHYVAKKCSLKHMKELLNIEGIKVDAHNVTGVTPLHIMMKKPTRDGLEYFLSQPGVDVNSRDANGETPLHTAAKNFHPEHIDVLLNFPGVDLTALDNNGQTVIHKAARSTKVQMMEIILDICGSLVDINKTDKNGATALHIAAMGKESGVLKKLLSMKGIDVNIADTKGQTPLHYAVKNGNVKIVQALVNFPGINKNAEDKSGKLPIDLLPRRPTRMQIENLLKQ